MTRRRTNTLSDSLLADVREASRRVLRRGVAGGSDRPFGETPVDASWLIVTEPPAAGDAARKLRGYLSRTDLPADRIAPASAPDVRAVRVAGAPCPYVGQACLVWGPRRKFGDDWCHQLIVPGDGRFLCGINGKDPGSGKYKCDAYPYLTGNDNPAMGVQPGAPPFSLPGAIFEDILGNDNMWASSSDNFIAIGFLRGYWDPGGGAAKRAILFGTAIPGLTCTSP